MRVDSVEIFGLLDWVERHALHLVVESWCFTYVASCFMHGPLVLNTGCILLVPHSFAPIPPCSVIVCQTEVLLILATPRLFLLL
jgi:hypothetical protein